MLKQRQGKRYVGYCVLFNLLPLEVRATRILVLFGLFYVVKICIRILLGLE